MITLDTIRKPVARQLEEFEAFVREQFRAEGELLSEMLEYALSTRGKAVRPTLVLLTAALHAPRGVEGVGRRAHVAAMLVEMIHVASLIHDDVIDEADTRRGRPSPNARWQSHNAVILGDYILARNMALGMQSGQYDLVSHVSNAISVLCEGEVLQSDCARRQVVSREVYYDVIRRKTASLFGVSASAGALSVGASPQDVALMREFGEELGLAFQIQDDLLDYSRSADTGKPANNDLREGKITLPLLYVLEQADPSRRRELLGALERAAQDDGALETLQQAVEQGGGIAESERVLFERISRAMARLSEMDPATGKARYPESSVRVALCDLCLYVAQRNR